ncbi:MAG: nitroreductase family protein [Nostocoides sp.]
MEFRETVRRRRMVRRFDPRVPLPLNVIRDLIDLATRAPSAGFSQGWDYLALTGPEQTGEFWTAAATDAPAAPDPWLAGLMSAPALVLALANPTAYLDRYAEPDKGWTDRSLDHWPIPYWDTDVAMGVMLILLGAVDAGLGALFFGVPGKGHQPVRDAFGIPGDRRIVGVVALGEALPHPKSPSLRRGRRGVEDVLHVGRYGEAPRSPSDDRAATVSVLPAPEE